jgi:hypothetical protein
LSLRNIPKLDKWNIVKHSFPKLKVCSQVCYTKSILCLNNFPSSNSQYCHPKCARWNIFEFEKLSFPTLKVMLPQIC